MNALINVKIARVSTVPYFVVTQLKSQIENIVDAGADVTVITSAGPELSRIASRANLKTVEIEIPRSFSPFRDLRALFALISIIRRSGFQIVHSTTPKAGLLCAIAARLCGVPVRLHTFTGQPWVTLTGPIAWAAKLADWLICRLNSLCYTDSPSQRQFLIDERIANPNQISVLGAGSLAGVDHARFDRARFPDSERRLIREQLGISESSKLVLFLGRICRDKGVCELLEAFDHVQSEGIDADLLLVGPFDEEQDAASKNLRSEIADRPRIHHVDYTATPERYLAVTDLLCLPSYREGFGTVIIEAAAMGVPALGTNIYGVRDAIVDQVTGLLVPPHDAGSLARAMVRVLSSPEILTALGQAAKTRGQSLFDASILNGKVIEEYKRLLRTAL